MAVTPDERQQRIGIVRSRRGSGELLEIGDTDRGDPRRGPRGVIRGVSGGRLFTHSYPR